MWSLICFMDELFLKKLSFLVFLLGFAGLFLLFSFQKPLFISLDSKIPLDETFKLNITIMDVYSSPSGSSIFFSYEVLDSGFFDGNATFLEKGDLVTLTGSKSGDYFSIDSISTLN